MGRYLLVCIFLVIFGSTSVCFPGEAVTPIDKVWKCAEWQISSEGPVHCSIVEEGCQIRISGEPYTLYSLIRFPFSARYCLNWDAKLESRLDHGALGLALGNENSGLIFQVTEENVAEVRSYRNGRTSKPRLSRSFHSEGREYKLEVIYDIRNGRCGFAVNGESIFDFSPRDTPNLSMTSSVRQVAVITSLDKGNRMALALHKSVGIQAR